MTGSQLKDTLKKKLGEGTFTSVDLPVFFELFVQLGNQIDDLQDEVIGWNRVVEFQLTGSGTYWVSINDSRFMGGTGSHPGTDFRLNMHADTAAGIFSGVKDAEAALNAGDIVIDGDLPDAIRLYDLIELVIEEIEY